MQLLFFEMYFRIFINKHYNYSSCNALLCIWPGNKLMFVISELDISINPSIFCYSVTLLTLCQLLLNFEEIFNVFFPINLQTKKHMSESSTTVLSHLDLHVPCDLDFLIPYLHCAKLLKKCFI